MTTTASDALASLRRWEREMILACRHEGWRPAHFIGLRYDTRPQGDLVAVVTRIALGQELQADLRERLLAAEGVVAHASLFDLATVAAARDLLDGAS